MRTEWRANEMADAVREDELVRRRGERWGEHEDYAKNVRPSDENGGESGGWAGRASSSATRSNGSAGPRRARTHVRLDREGPSSNVLVLTLDRPERANAYTEGMLVELLDALDMARTDASIESLIVTGRGDSFCGGADLAELDARDEKDGLALLSREVFDRWAEAPYPTIAAINGPAVGGGFELALASDLRVCGPRASFRLPEVGVGLLPAAGGIRRLVDQLGVGLAKELILFGRKLDADTALRWGLVSEVVADPRARSIDLVASLTAPDRMCLEVAKMLIHDQTETLRGRRAEGIAQALFYGRRKRARVS